MSDFITYEGNDLTATCLFSDSAAINMVYIEFYNTGGSSSHTEDAADGRDYYDTMEDTAASTKKDYLRVPVMTAPIFDTSDEDKYTSNKVSVMGMTSGTTGEGGLTFSNAAGSVVYGAALVYSEDTSDKSKDIVFSRHYFSDITKEANQEISFYITHTVTVV